MPSIKLDAHDVAANASQQRSFRTPAAHAAHTPRCAFAGQNIFHRLYFLLTQFWYKQLLAREQVSYLSDRFSALRRGMRCWHLPLLLRTATLLSTTASITRARYARSQQQTAYRAFVGGLHWPSYGAT